jgi:predicted MPP superfamily phosphohydrolase
VRVTRVVVMSLMFVVSMSGSFSTSKAVAGQSQSAPAATGLPALLEKTGYTYSKLSDTVYEVPATGKNRKEFAIRFTQADDVMVVIGKFADRKDVTINQTLTQKLLELNNDFDVVKFALSDEILYARIDIHVRLVDVDEMKYLVKQMAEVVDEAYPHIKPFIKTKPPAGPK